MLKLIKELESTSSSCKKISILSLHKDNDRVKKAFYYCYNPFFAFNVNKIQRQKPGIQTFEQSFYAFEELAHKLNSRELTGNNAIETIKNFFKQCDSDAQEVYFRIIKRNMGCGVNVASLNKVFNNLIPTFSVQLANKYNPEKDYQVDYFWASNKLDGLRCVYIEGKLLTRSGKQIVGFDDLEKELKDLCRRYKVEFLDGELFSKKISFQKIQGAVLRNKDINKEEKNQIFYNLFVASSSRSGNSFTSTNEMIKFLESLDLSHYKQITTIAYQWVNNDFNSINNLMKVAVSKGYEGLMLRNPKNWYSFDRDDNLLKYKPFLEEDFIITALEEGNGKYQTMLGALHVAGKYQGKHVVSRVGTGFSDEERKLFFDPVFIGKKVEIIFQEVTTKKESQGKEWSLRFPVFSKLKEDR